MSKTKEKYFKQLGQVDYWKWLMLYTKPYLSRITLLLILQFATTLLTVSLAVVGKNIIDSASVGNIIKWNIMIYIAIIIGSQIINMISSFISLVLNERFAFGIKKQVYEKIIHSYWTDIKSYHTGDLMTRLTSDVNNIAEGIVGTIPNIICLFLELVVSFGTLFYYASGLAIFALVLAPVAAGICLILGRKLKKLQLKVQESESAYRSFLQESMSNLLVVKSFTNEEYMVDKLSKLRDERFGWIVKRSKLGIISTATMSLVFQFGYIVAFTFGAVQISKGAITYGTMSIFLTLVNRIQGPILELARNIPRIVSILTSAGRVIEIQEIPEEAKAEQHIDGKDISINVQDVTFGYTEENVLEEASLKIGAGEFVGIVGESGIGKTTLVRLLMSFMSNMEGIIQFQNASGEKELANVGTREFMAYVPQGNTLFSGTIRENIRMGKLDATDEEIMKALKMSAAYEFISELPNGIDTVIGERGHGLSEGQAQRIAIARALVRNAPFLILDEATSALDEKTEIAVLKGIQQLSPRPTCVLITHRKSVLPYCDREIRIHNKKIISTLVS